MPAENASLSNPQARPAFATGRCRDTLPSHPRPGTGGPSCGCTPVRPRSAAHPIPSAAASPRPPPASASPLSAVTPPRSGLPNSSILRPPPQRGGPVLNVATSGQILTDDTRTQLSSCPRKRAPRADRHCICGPGLPLPRERRKKRRWEPSVWFIPLVRFHLSPDTSHLSFPLRNTWRVSSRRCKAAFVRLRL